MAPDSPGGHRRPFAGSDSVVGVPELPVGKRPFHAFLSHAHVDREHADRLAGWLRDVVDAPIWYDAVNLPPGATVAAALPDAIERSRSLILLLSKDSVRRGWVQQEFNLAINHQTRYPDFRIIPVRLDDVEPPGFLQNYSNVPLGADGPDLESAAGILKGLYQPAATFDATNGRNVYLGRGWHVNDGPLADVVTMALAAAGLQLIGDSEDQPSWVETRVDGIIGTCGAFAAVLPYRANAPQRTSKYVLREWELAEARGLPCLVVADPRVELSPETERRRGLVRLPGPEAADSGNLMGLAETLREDWRAAARSPYIFYATGFGDESERLRRGVRELVEAVTALPCVLGEYVRGDVVQREILRAVCGAVLVLADISGDGPNVYVELGAARGAGVPVAVLRQGKLGRPPFMLRDQQVWDYATPADLLGRVTRIAYPYRRTLLASSRP
jgi:hypothetical protein